jgi:hypothetical protein
MENHFSLSDVEFEKQFESATFDPKLFNHEAHIRLAWIHLRKYGIERAVVNVRKQLIEFVEILGAKDKYNETVTVAAIKTVNHFMKRSDTNNFKEFVDENPRLKFQFKELLSFHYRTNVFISELAKKEFLEPDLLPFD